VTARQVFLTRDEELLARLFVFPAAREDDPMWRQCLPTCRQVLLAVRPVALISGRGLSATLLVFLAAPWRVT
jgi:hypothetical protein